MTDEFTDLAVSMINANESSEEYRQFRTRVGQEHDVGLLRMLLNEHYPHVETTIPIAERLRDILPADPDAGAR